MNLNFLKLEQPIIEVEAKIEELRLLKPSDEIDINEEIKNLEHQRDALIKSIFSSLSPWEITQMARHPQRPHMVDYIHHIFTEFDELHGDRHYKDDLAIVGGIARFEDQAVMIIGQEKGRNTKEKVARNFGMVSPEGYRKALRLMKLAEKFSLPIITFIDTAGAYPGIGAEERNQSEAIAKNLLEMSHLNTPIISLVIGEGGSGGALAIGVCDRLLMLRYSIYSVISPEGCASILWKSAEKAEQAASIMGITSDKLKELKIADEIIEEPVGGAHRNIELLMENVKTALQKHLQQLITLPKNALLELRYEKLMSVGRISS